MLLHLNLPYAVPCLISWEWTGPLVNVWYMRGPLCSQNRNEHWGGVYLVWSSLEVSLLGVEQSWGEFMERNGRGRHQYPAPRPPCGSVALSLTWSEKSLKAKYMCLFDLIENISILSDCDENRLILGLGLSRFLTRQCQRERLPFVEEDPKIVRINWKQIEINAAMHKLCKQETPSIILLFTSSWIGTGEIFEILTKEQFFWCGTLLNLTLKLKFFRGLFLYCQYCMKVFHSWDKTLQEPFLTKHLKLLISVKDVFPSWNFPNTAPARSYLIFLKSDIVDEGVGVHWKERISLFSQNL